MAKKRIRADIKTTGVNFLTIITDLTDIPGKAARQVFSKCEPIPVTIRNYAIALSQAVIKYSNDVIELIAFSEKVWSP
jgi:hypothetical protein